MCQLGLQATSGRQVGMKLLRRSQAHRYSSGITAHRMMYTIMPGNAAENIESRMYRIRTASESQPSQRAIPPHTPAIICHVRCERSDLRAWIPPVSCRGWSRANAAQNCIRRRLRNLVLASPIGRGSELSSGEGFPRRSTDSLTRSRQCCDQCRPTSPGGKVKLATATPRQHRPPRPLGTAPREN